DARRARSLVREISDRFGFEVDPDAMVEDIPVGVQQRVEIIKALSRDARVLILDEPTAVLTLQETDELIAIMRQLKEAGTSIVFITHKLREVRAVADRITVIRRGKVVGTADPSASETELASLMVGRSVSLGVDKEPARPGDATFRVTDLTVMDDLGTAVVDRVSLDVARGEILVVAGVQGNGQTELTETIVGLRKPVAGSITLDDTELVGRGVAEVLAAGVGYVPEDRSTDGIVARSPWRRTSCSTCSTACPTRAAERSTRARSATTRSSASWSSTCARRTCRSPRARSRAATSRRSCSRGRCRGRCACSSRRSRHAASTWAPSSSCTSASWRSATTARP